MQEEVARQAEDGEEGAEGRRADQPEIGAAHRVAELVACQQLRIDAASCGLGPERLHADALRPLLDREQHQRQQQQRYQADDDEGFAPAVLGDQRGVELRDHRVAEAGSREHQAEGEPTLGDEPARDDGDADDQPRAGERRAHQHPHQVDVGERIDRAVAVQAAAQQQGAGDHDRPHAVAVREPAADRRERSRDEQLDGVAELERAALDAELGEQLGVEDVHAGEGERIRDPDDHEGWQHDAPPPVELPGRTIHGASLHGAPCMRATHAPPSRPSRRRNSGSSTTGTPSSAAL